MERVAIPVFESRVSPVLDSCQRMVVVDIENGCEIRRKELTLEKMSLYERIEVMARWGIRKIICAGISDMMCKYLAGRNIALSVVSPVSLKKLSMPISVTVWMILAISCRARVTNRTNKEPISRDLVLFEIFLLNISLHQKIYATIKV